MFQGVCDGGTFFLIQFSCEKCNRNYDYIPCLLVIRVILLGKVRQYFDRYIFLVTS